MGWVDFFDGEHCSWGGSLEGDQDRVVVASCRTKNKFI